MLAVHKSQEKYSEELCECEWESVSFEWNYEKAGVVEIEGDLEYWVAEVEF